MPKPSRLRVRAVPQSGIAEIQTGNGLVFACIMRVTKAHIDVANVKYSRRTWRRLGWKGAGPVPFIRRFRGLRSRVPVQLVMLAMPGYAASKEARF